MLLKIRDYFFEDITYEFNIIVLTESVYFDVHELLFFVIKCVNM